MMHPQASASMTIDYPPGVPPYVARVYRNVSSTAGLASYLNRIGE